jgi:uncharacterized membrane protein YccC
VIGAVVAVAMTALCAQDRAAFLITLALWGGTCALVATLLQNFAAYAAALAGYAAAIIASDQLGATGGASGDVFILALIRATEICLASSPPESCSRDDFGTASRRLARRFGALSERFPAWPEGPSPSDLWLADAVSCPE